MRWPRFEDRKEATMRNRQVPRAEWFNFFRGFSKRHADAPATVRVLSPRLGCQIEARDLPLEGIVTDRAGHGPISIHVGRDTRRHVEHDVEDPIQVWVELAES